MSKYIKKGHPREIRKCRYCGDERITTQDGMSNHENHCSCNPNHLERKSHTISDETRKKISESLKIAHAEGRAHNIGSSRWHNEHSYPEKWFIKMLEHELNMIEHIDYETEYPFYKYSLDFAWPNYKLCIEVDGEQHQRFEEYANRDAKKDALLVKDDWKILRIRWGACVNNTKDCIHLVKEFLNQSDITESYLEFKLKEQSTVDKTPYLIELKNKRWDIIKASNIDFTKFGWVKKISELFGISENKAGSYIRKNFPEFYKECCFKRK